MRQPQRLTYPVVAMLSALVLLGAEGAPVHGDEAEPASERAPVVERSEGLGPDPLALDGPVPTAVQRAVGQRVTALLSPDGEKRSDGVPVGLDHGVIGVIGSTAEGYTLVVTKETDGRALVAKLTARLPKEAAEGLEVRVSERSADELREAWHAAFEPQKWRTAIASDVAGMAVELDPEREAVVVTLGGEPPREGRLDTLAQPLQGVDAGSVVVEYGGKAGRASRAADSAPHWGGARITKASGASCTAGFTARGKTTGTYYSVTAGHCGANGTDWHSGSSFYGTTAGRADYPDYDQARLGGSTYSPNIYTDGLDSFSSRVVTGANNGAVGDSVCASGQVTKAICGIEIKALDATYCDNPGVESTCTYYLMRGRRDDDKVIVRDGDSGGPVYQRNTSLPRASIRGMVIAYDLSGVRLYAERYTSISDHLNVTAVTAG